MGEKPCQIARANGKGHGDGCDVIIGAKIFNIVIVIEIEWNN